VIGQPTIRGVSDYMKRTYGLWNEGSACRGLHKALQMWTAVSASSETNCEKVEKIGTRKPVAVEVTKCVYTREELVLPYGQESAQEYVRMRTPQFRLRNLQRNTCACALHSLGCGICTGIRAHAHSTV
jgi:hypothetical protein